MCRRTVTLALATLTSSPRSAFSACNRGAKRATYPEAPVILISIDTLRADRLPAYGYKGVETPNIDALRADGVLFTDAYSQVPLTLPSHASLLTGLLPADNGVRNNIGYRLEDPKRPSIPTTLKAAGYATGAAISSYVLRASTGLGALFDDYDDAIVPKPGEPIGTLQRSGYASEEIAAAWIAKHKGERFFYMFHIFEPHSPYEAPEPFASRYKNPYDAEVATADDIVGKFVASLKASGVYDDAIVILISDHGEGLNDHGEPEHGIFLYREAIHVPLIVKLPKRARAGETVGRPVALVDLFPTITGAHRDRDARQARGAVSLRRAEGRGVARDLQRDALPAHSPRVERPALAGRQASITTSRRRSRSSTPFATIRERRRTSSRRSGGSTPR